MISEYYLREKCSKAIANKVAKRAIDFVSDEMIKQAERLSDVQAEFNEMVDAAAHKLLNGGH